MKNLKFFLPLLSIILLTSCGDDWEAFTLHSSVKNMRKEAERHQQKSHIYDRWWHALYWYNARGFDIEAGCDFLPDVQSSIRQEMGRCRHQRRKNAIELEIAAKYGDFVATEIKGGYEISFGIKDVPTTTVQCRDYLFITSDLQEQMWHVILFLPSGRYAIYKYCKLPKTGLFGNTQGHPQAVKLIGEYHNVEISERGEVFVQDTPSSELRKEKLSQKVW